MADNIVLKTYKGGNVTPQDDAIIYETAIPGSGIFKGCEVTYASGWRSTETWSPPRRRT